ncbi:MAG: hypothetical protein QGG34_00325 [SAR202 cluster bacterium]|nr:hypothetical protein [SAR202 cluster bacterium]MDP7103539.1 hypothetical protein [SAR202 cluster bacterium]MDP7223925.1 hypothetical protein [SAR202 cluster bacterium]MDP7413219.1 hypothetical protein [SAR202 cluster bacterium]MDP7534537.1 hypothetical protein [SAR202 cluster bacterium]
MKYLNDDAQSPSTLSDESFDGVRGRVGAYHRTLSTYLNGLVGAGLAIEELVEPRGAVPTLASMRDTSAVPAFLAVRCRKP